MFPTLRPPGATSDWLTGYRKIDIISAMKTVKSSYIHRLVTLDFYTIRGRFPHYGISK